MNQQIISQRLHGIDFSNPIGLAAGFDYDAHLMNAMAKIGFGYETVGTVTNLSYGGNPPPVMGRLPKSKSLMVNKGFKSSGAEKAIARMEGQEFGIPIGVSIGRSNSKTLTNEAESVRDIVECFEKFENSKVDHLYYELNISCPNLFGNISFYPAEHLAELLKAVEELRLNKPVFIKMPIEQTNDKVLEMLEIISTYQIAGVIFGNLQKNRKDPALDPEEVAKFPVGYFTGKPTWQRSNECIALAYKHYGKKLTIIGCGGVFSPDDAYQKILIGSSLVQLITGMVFVGQHLIRNITSKLPELLRADGFDHISEAVGKGTFSSSVFYTKNFGVRGQ